MANGLFGPTPSDIRDQQRVRDLQELQVFGSLPSGTLSGVTSGRLLGQGLMGAAGVGNPELQRATAAQEARMEIQSSGIPFGTPEYFDRAADILQSKGLVDEAIKAKAFGLQFQPAGTSPLDQAKIRNIDSQIKERGREKPTEAIRTLQALIDNPEFLRTNFFVTPIAFRDDFSRVVVEKDKIKVRVYYTTLKE